MTGSEKWPVASQNPMSQIGSKRITGQSSRVHELQQHAFDGARLSRHRLSSPPPPAITPSAVMAGRDGFLVAVRLVPKRHIISLNVVSLMTIMCLAIFSIMARK